MAETPALKEFMTSRSRLFVLLISTPLIVLVVVGGVLGREKLLLKRGIRGQRIELAKRGQVGDPGVADRIGDQPPVRPAVIHQADDGVAAAAHEHHEILASRVVHAGQHSW